MLTSISNKYCKIIADTSGGELISFEDSHSVHYLHDGNPYFWRFHAPALFPIIGRFRDGTYTFDGNSYPMTSHGFARTAEFTLIDVSEASIAYELCSNDQFKAFFPFDFSFIIRYTLHKKTVQTSYHITATGSDPLYFSVGGHPALACPIGNGIKFEDYYLEFSEKETIDRYEIDADGFIIPEPFSGLDNENIIHLKYDLFTNDALIYNGLQSDSITLRCHKSDRAIRFDFPEFPWLGIWTKTNPANTPFICLEPWFGHDDFSNAPDELIKKDGIIHLNSKESFSCTYAITIL